MRVLTSVVSLQLQYKYSLVAVNMLKRYQLQQVVPRPETCLPCFTLHHGARKARMWGQRHRKYCVGKLKALHWYTRLAAFLRGDCYRQEVVAGCPSRHTWSGRQTEVHRVIRHPCLEHQVGLAQVFCTEPTPKAGPEQAYVHALGCYLQGEPDQVYEYVHSMPHGHHNQAGI